MTRINPDAIVAYIEQSRGHARLKDIARHANVSTSYLSRLLKEQTGSSFREHSYRIRMIHAELLLRTSMESIKSVAFDSGYPTAANFWRAFRRVHHCSPTEWRATHRK